MKKFSKILMSASLMTLIMTSCGSENTSTDIVEPTIDATANEGNIIPGQYIVVFKDSEITPTSKLLSKSAFTNRETKAKSVETLSETSITRMKTILSDNKLEESKVLNYYTTEISGIAIKLSDEEFQAFSKDSNIEIIEHDRIIELPDVEIEKTTTSETAQKLAQTTPCGISNAGGAADGSQKDEWIWIIDTGIDLDHPDLNVITDTSYAKSFVGGTADDCDGHGTHVAGTAAAINNSIGVVGVSAGASVVPVKVFGCNGESTSTSIILAAINHVGSYDIAGDVTNLSLGGYFGSGCSSSSSYRSALLALSNSGTYVAIAAGNSSADSALYDPACINGTNIYTVASMNCNGSFSSSFSNYNMNPIDVIATGSSVYSTYLNGGYATVSGTSMASPHVAGIMHARGSGPSTSGSVTYRSENYPIAVR